MRAKSASLLWYLNFFDDEDGVFEREWQKIKLRYADEVQGAIAEANTYQGQSATVDGLVQLVLGAYVGLARQGSYAPRLQANTRQLALYKRIKESSDEALANELREAIISSSLFSLRDSYSNIRFVAFDTLLELGYERELLAAEALASGIADLGVRGMELPHPSQPRSGPRSARGCGAHPRRQSVPTRAGLVGRTSRGSGRLHHGSESISRRIRTYAVREAQRLLAEEPQAGQVLEKALNSRDIQLRLQAALAFADNQDPRATETLLYFVNSMQ